MAGKWLSPAFFHELQFSAEPRFELGSLSIARSTLVIVHLCSLSVTLVVVIAVVIVSDVVAVVAEAVVKPKHDFSWEENSHLYWICVDSPRNAKRRHFDEKPNFPVYWFLCLNYSVIQQFYFIPTKSECEGKCLFVETPRKYAKLAI